MKETELRELHSKSTMNRHAIESSDQVGCFCCERIWDPLDFPIKNWIDEHADKNGNATALCPFCGIDSIVAKLSVGKVTVYMLDQLERYWFGMKRNKKPEKPNGR